MSYIELYDRERLIEVETDPCKYYVLRKNGPSPLEVMYKVRKKDVLGAIGLFKDHPKGIEKYTLSELHFKRGTTWHPSDVEQHISNKE